MCASVQAGLLFPFVLLCPLVDLGAMLLVRVSKLFLSWV